jgi:hypothetical protein
MSLSSVKLSFKVKSVSSRGTIWMCGWGRLSLCLMVPRGSLPFEECVVAGARRPATCSAVMHGRARAQLRQMYTHCADHHGFLLWSPVCKA